MLWWRFHKQGPFHYADVSVTCDDRDRTACQYIRYPCFVAEVLSPSTEAVDRGEKFRQYRRIETLQEYLLIDLDHLSLECYRLNERGNWELFQFSVDGSEAEAEACEVELTSVGLTFPLSLLYERQRAETLRSHQNLKCLKVLTTYLQHFRLGTNVCIRGGTKFMLH